MTTLLEQAKQVPKGKTRYRGDNNFDELFEVAMAYASGEISGSQARAVVAGSKKNIAQHLSQIMLIAVKRGYLVRKNGSG